MRTRIGKWGHSLAVRIPKAFAEELGLKRGAEVDISAAKGRLIISVPGHIMENLVKEITPDNRHGATDWGTAAGRELW